MNILAPVNATAEVDPLIDSGATELYCGFMPVEQLEKYTGAVWMNRRAFRASIHDQAELDELVRRAHGRGAPVSLTLNAPYYTYEQYDDAFRTVETAAQAGMDTLIVADLGIILTLRQAGIEMDLCLSTVGDCYNTETARFFKELGISRVILPRHLSLTEIKQFVDKSDGLEFEAFIMNSRCVFEDGLCLTAHSVAELPNFCVGPQEYRAYLRDGGELTPREADRIADNAQTYHEWCLISQHDYHPGCPQGFACGLCAIPHLAELGVSALKVVGRGKPLELKVWLTRAVRQIVAGLETGLSPGELKQRSVQLFGNEIACRRGFTCYYREANPFLHGAFQEEAVLAPAETGVG